MPAPINKADTPIGQRLQVLRLALSLAFEVNPEELQYLFPGELIIFLRKQLSTPQLTSHNDICMATNRLLLKLKPESRKEHALKEV